MQVVVSISTNSEVAVCGLNARTKLDICVHSIFLFCFFQTFGKKNVIFNCSSSYSGRPKIWQAQMLRKWFKVVCAWVLVFRKTIQKSTETNFSGRTGAQWFSLRRGDGYSCWGTHTGSHRIGSGRHTVSWIWWTWYLRNSFGTTGRVDCSKKS